MSWLRGGAMHGNYHKLNIIGVLWQGVRGAYTYEVRFIPVSDTEVNQLAVDFQSVLDWQVVRIEQSSETVGQKLIHTRSEEVVRDWAKPASEDLWAEMEACGKC